MFNDRKAHIDEARRHFERALESRSADAAAAGEGYIERLDDYLRAFERGPAADAAVSRVDTTGSIHETEDFAEWAWQERRRVMHLLRDLPAG